MNKKLSKIILEDTKNGFISPNEFLGIYYLRCSINNFDTTK